MLAYLVVEELLWDVVLLPLLLLVGGRVLLPQRGMGHFPGVGQTAAMGGRGSAHREAGQVRGAELGAREDSRPRSADVPQSRPKHGSLRWYV